MNWTGFLIVAGILLVGWLINLPIESRLAGRGPTPVETILSLFFLVVGVFCTYLIFSNWNQIKNDQGLYLWGFGLSMAVIAGSILEVFMTNLESGKPFNEVQPYPLLMAMVTAVVVFLGFWVSIEGQPEGIGTVGLAVTAGYGWKGFYSQAKEVLNKKP